MAVFLIFSLDLKIDLVGVTFFLLVVQSIVFLSTSFSRSINLISIYCLFSLVFMSFIPWVHYSEKIALWRLGTIGDNIYIVVNFIILSANLVVFISYYLFKNKNLILKERTTIKNTRLTILTLFVTSILCFILLFYMNDFSILKLLFRGLVDEQRVAVIETSTLVLLLSMISRLAPVFCYFFAITQISGFRKLKFFLFCLMLISVFPTGVARYMVAYVYIPWFLIFIPVMRRTTVFSFALLMSIFFIFPFLEQFRYFSGIQSISFLPSKAFFYSPHFDAYENFASSVENDFVSYGFQLLGSILFFVPRDFWPNKPIGSGQDMAERLGYIFDNISMPFLGEGYVNFGFYGVILFSFFIGFFMSKIDHMFAVDWSKKSHVNYPVAVYFFLLGALFFMLRGDLMSSFAYMMAGVAVAIFVRNIVFFVNRFNLKL